MDTNVSGKKKRNRILYHLSIHISPILKTQEVNEAIMQKLELIKP